MKQQTLIKLTIGILLSSGLLHFNSSQSPSCKLPPTKMKKATKYKSQIYSLAEHKREASKFLQKAKMDSICGSKEDQCSVENLQKSSTFSNLKHFLSIFELRIAFF